MRRPSPLPQPPAPSGERERRDASGRAPAAAVPDDIAEEAEDDLTAPGWTLLQQDIPGTGAPVSAEDFDAPADAQRFYRVEVME